jgi:serine/threonine protein kinase/tetratricopeptide (TPR) repeat protein
VSSDSKPPPFAPAPQLPTEIEAEMMVYIGDENVAKFSLRHGEYIIGRDQGCQVCIDVEGISRHHARLTFQGYELTIEDLGSANGVFLEGVQIQLPTRVRPDQQVEVGSARIFVRLKAESSEMLAAALWDPDLGLAPVRAVLEGKKYKVLGTIGRGGMGIVHQARDLRIVRNVAMKVIKTSSQFSRENVLRFVDEAQLTGQLQHPNIIPVYELGIDEFGEVFYTMKYVKGTTLDQVLRRIREGEETAIQKYRLATLLTAFQKMCDGVAYAHSMGVVHRDLKPDNVMIGEYGEVLVMDWGLAKKMASGMHDEHLGDTKPQLPPSDLRGFETLNGLIVGTPPYISPEAARGELDRIDPRSDIFVLGTILYAILTLRPPFPGKEFGELIEQIVTGKFMHPSSYSQPVNPLRPSEPPAAGPDGVSCILSHLPGRRVPEGLAAIVVKAMAAEPELRYQTVAELQADILSWQGGFATKAERAGLARQLMLWAGRHKANVVIFGVFFILLNAALAVFVLSLKHERDRATGIAQDATLSAERLRQALKDLRGVGPLRAEEAKGLMTKGKPDAALASLDAAIRQVPNDPDFYYLRGNILQTLLRWDEAVDAYEEALERNPEHRAATENLALTRKLIEAVPEGHEPTTAELRLLEESLIKQKRIAEANYLTGRFGPDKPLAVKLLRDALDKSPQLKPLREFLRGTDLRGRFQRLDDGTYSANFRGLPPRDYLLLIRNEVVPVSVLYLDDPNFADLSIFAGMDLRELWLAGCARVADLEPLRDMKLKVLNLNRTGVRDLSALAGMPLVELSLDYCTKITDFKPLMECRSLEKLILPKNARTIDFLRTHPSLKFLSTKGVSEPAEEFWADHDKRRKGSGKPTEKAEKTEKDPPNKQTAPSAVEAEK